MQPIQQALQESQGSINTLQAALIAAEQQRDEVGAEVASLRVELLAMQATAEEVSAVRAALAAAKADVEQGAAAVARLEEERSALQEEQAVLCRSLREVLLGGCKLLL